jgi:hypothetical protein
MEMKRLSLYVFAIALTLGVAASLLTGVAARSTQSASSQIYKATNAAFRDGLYVGKLDAAQGNRPHVGSGRWGADQDRRAYVAGYQRGYNQILQSIASKMSSPQLAETAGYRDGIVDGTMDRRAAKPFRVTKTDNYRSAIRGVADVESDQERSRQAYRKAYANGYQEAYYGREHATPENSSQLSSSL